MQNLIGSVTDLVNDLHDITVNKYFYIRVEDDCKSIHVANARVFFELFNTYDTKARNDSEFPYEVFLDVEGVIFFTILKQEAYEKYVLKKCIKNASA